MEFWGVEVKAGEPLKVTPGAGRVIHISQAALGEGKKEKANDLVPLRLKINGQKFVVGSLSGEKFPQVTFDLVFEKEFELSHDWKNGSVYFCGYSAENPFEDEEDGFDSESDDDEDIPTLIAENGKIEAKVEVPIAAATKVKAAKPESSAKPKVTVVEPQKDDDSDEDESDDDEDESDDDEDMKDVLDSISDSDDEDDSEEEDEETPKKEKAGPSKKRATESATKTPVPAKKAKLDTPQKTDGKKGGGHTATPHPSKKAGKSPAANNSNKSKEQTPKSEGKVTCKSCSRTFNSDKALESHSKAKHASN